MKRISSRNRIDSSLEEPAGRQVCIVTTASVPWKTGTAINPLLRAAYLAHETTCKVTLVIPWLAVEEQAAIFPEGLTFFKPSEQAAYVRTFVLERCRFTADFDFVFYPARYDKLFFSISPAQGSSIIDAIPYEKRDCAILEEPEHLNWWERRNRWTDEFQHVVGVMHTNYYQYVLEEAGQAAAHIIRRTTGWLTRIHCHKVIKLSDAIQDLPRSVTQFTHGVASGFLEVGKASAAQRGQLLGAPIQAAGDQQTDADSASQAPLADDEGSFDRGAYFIGKAVWGKGHGTLLQRMKEAKDAGSSFHLDCYGSGEDEEEIKARAAQLGLDIDFRGAIDHLSPDVHGYKVLVNASLSDVVATTTAEALAMGKWVLVARHPENAFFEQFKNCLIYESSDDFVRLWKHAIENDPPPLTQEDYDRLTWEAATQRLLQAAAIRAEEWPSTTERVADLAIWNFYRPFSWIEVLSRALGKHGGGRDAEADLLRLASEDPELLAAPPPPLSEQRSVRMSLVHRWHGWRLQIGGGAA